MAAAKDPRVKIAGSQSRKKSPVVEARKYGSPALIRELLGDEVRDFRRMVQPIRGHREDQLMNGGTEHGNLESAIEP